MSIDPSKAHRWDEIPARVIKICDDSLIIPLKSIFMNCLRHGIFPETWKRANVLNILRKTIICEFCAKHLKENHHPIPLLPIFGKILEKLIYDSLLQYLERENY